MSKYFIIVSLTILLFACKSEPSSNSIRLDCHSINELINRDQDLRKTKLQGQFFPNVDSIMKAKGYSEGLDDISSIDAELKSEIWSEAKSLEKKYSTREITVRDSLWTVQHKIDSLNTLEVIKQIEVFGIDSLNNMDKICDQNSLLIFVHCPDGLKSRVAKIIEENKDGVGENRFRHISWHLNGRKN